MILGQLTKLFKADPRDEQANYLYLAIVSQSRQPEIYQTAGVTDTVDGRFDIIALHVFLLSRALKERDDDLAQRVVDRMFVDMDQSLREMGVGDVSMGRKMQKMAYALNGRMEKYEEYWDDKDAFTETLWRNVYRGDESKKGVVSQLADYCHRADEMLRQLPLESFEKAELNWPDITV